MQRNLYPGFCVFLEGGASLDKYRFLKIREHPQWKGPGADWFHQKWGVSREAYLESMEACLRKESAVPQWYLLLQGETIVGGLGVIENDFHCRKDLTPNVCAVYVEKAHRGQGLAGEMLRRVCEDMKEQQIDPLYLVTDHTGFYERYGWEFLCMVREESGLDTRMYIHREGNC